MGQPFGGPDYNPYVAVEIHYNNPKMISGQRDSSGMRFKFTEKLRQHDSSVTELGVEYSNKMAIPPGRIAFPLTGFCVAECTKVGFPQNGITIIGSQFHTHGRGVRGCAKLSIFFLFK